jgi:hypothetical protein
MRMIDSRASGRSGPGPQRVNLLTNSALDPTSRRPEFQVCAVRLALAAERETGCAHAGWSLSLSA